MTRRLAIFLGVWTVVVVAVILFWPSSVPEGGCWVLVDAPAHCLDELAAANDHIWWTQKVPILAFLSSGYVVIGAAAFRRLARSRHLDTTA